MSTIRKVCPGILIMGLLILMSGCGGSDTTTEPVVTPPPTTGASWQWTNPLPTGNPLLASAYNSANGHYVAVGQRGTILTSDDRITWVQRDSGTDVTLTAVIAIGGDALLAVGEQGTILTTSDEVQWHPANSSATTDLNGVAWDGTNIIVVGDGGTILTSPDGVTWTSQGVPPIVGDIMAVAGDGTIFVVVDDQGYIATSPNLSSWAVEPQLVTTALLAITWRGGRYLATGDDGVILTSPDGADWTQRTAGVTADLTGAGGVIGGPLIVVGRYNHSGNEVLTSTDSGVTWTRQTAGSDTRLLGLSDDGSTAMATGFGGAIITSDNGVDWTPALPTTATELGRLQSVVWNGNQFLISGAIEVTPGNFGVLTSADGQIWAGQGSANAPSGTVTWDGTEYLGVLGVNVVTSTAGLSWTGTAVATGLALNAVIHDDLGYMAVGNNGTVYGSSDGNTWTAEESGATTSLTMIASNNSTRVVVGDNGALLVQTGQGQAWTAPVITGLGTRSLFGVTFGDNVFVAVGEYGTVITSSDGTSWQFSQISGASRLRDVTWDGNQFLAVADPGAAYTSPDAVIWTARDAGTDNTLTAVAGNQDVAVAVGWDGTIIRSVSTP